MYLCDFGVCNKYITVLITVNSLYLSTCKTETSEAIHLIRSHCTIRMVLKLILQGKNLHAVTLILCEAQALRTEKYLLNA